MKDDKPYTVIDISNEVLGGRRPTPEWMVGLPGMNVVRLPAKFDGPFKRPLEEEKQCNDSTS